MARRQLSAATLIQCAILLVLVWSKGTAAISLEEKLQQLEEKLESKLALVEAENVHLTGKVTQLELQLQQQVSPFFRHSFSFPFDVHFHHDFHYC
jgi:hypothetical protein